MRKQRGSNEEGTRKERGRNAEGTRKERGSNEKKSRRKDKRRVDELAYRGGWMSWQIEEGG
jgi:hypothetical protein